MRTRMLNSESNHERPDELQEQVHRLQAEIDLLKMRGEKKYSWVELVLVGFIVTGVVLAICFYWINVGHSLTTSSEHWGQLGDFFGGILNPFLGFFTIVLLLATLRQSREALAQGRDALLTNKEELVETRREVRASAEALHQQVEAMKQQRAQEDTHYQHSLHHRVVLERAKSLEEALSCVRHWEIEADFRCEPERSFFDHVVFSKQKRIRSDEQALFNTHIFKPLLNFSRAMNRALGDSTCLEIPPYAPAAIQC